MLKNVLSISGRPGLYRLVNRGKNMLIVESIATKKRMPAYAHDKIISLGDITMYTIDDDVPLGTVLENVKSKNNAQIIDIKAIGNDAAVREYFAEILPDFDREKVYTSDIKKLFTWYNQLIEAGIMDFADKDEVESDVESAPEKE